MSNQTLETKQLFSKRKWLKSEEKSAVAIGANICVTYKIVSQLAKSSREIMCENLGLHIHKKINTEHRRSTCQVPF